MDTRALGAPRRPTWPPAPSSTRRTGVARVSVFSVICHTLRVIGITTDLKNGVTMISSRVEGNHSDEQHP